jgi:hypothetical protein
MKNIQRIQAVLARMTELCRVGGVGTWASALEKARNAISTEPDATVSEILSMYGGMGSLNDIILYADGQPLIPENTELDELRSTLYSLCHE